MRRLANALIRRRSGDEDEAEANAVGAARNDPVAGRDRPDLPSTAAVSPSPPQTGQSIRREARNPAYRPQELFFTPSEYRPTQTIDRRLFQDLSGPIAPSPLPPPSTPRPEEAILLEATGPKNQDPLPGATPAQPRSKSSLDPLLFQTAYGDLRPPMSKRNSPSPFTPTQPPEETSTHDVVGPGKRDPQPDATPPRRRPRSSDDSVLFQTARSDQHAPMPNPDSPSSSPPTPPLGKLSRREAVEPAIQYPQPVVAQGEHRSRSPLNPSLFQTARGCQDTPVQNADSASPSPPAPLPGEVIPPEAIGHRNQNPQAVATHSLESLFTTARGNQLELGADCRALFPSPLPFEDFVPPDASPNPGQDVDTAHPYPQTRSPAPGVAIAAPLPHTAPSPAPSSPPRPMFCTGNSHCLASSPLSESAGNLVTAGVGLEVGPLRRQMWARLEEQLVDAHIQRAARLRVVAAADEEAFRLCPCPEGHVELSELLVDHALPRLKRHEGRTEASLEERRELFQRASESLTMVRGLGVADRAFMKGVREMNAVCGADGEYKKWLRFPPRQEALVRWMMCIDAQTGGLYARVADMEAKVLHVKEMCFGKCVGEQSSNAASDYILALRQCVRESEDAIADLLLTRQLLSDSLELVLCRSDEN